MKKRALITGVTGQDGSYLAELLLNKGYKVYGLIRRSSSELSSRLNNIIENKNFLLLDGDITDQSSLLNILIKVKPNEIYNLAAQSDVAISFKEPEYTAQVNAIGTLKILDTIVKLKMHEYSRFYQASTSELYGKALEIPQTEKTPFYPRSPYAISKLYSFWTTINYRESYGVYACNGILFNHESPRRGSNFVTKKVTLGISKIFLGIEKVLFVGNLNAKRDWGHAKEYVEMQWLMLQQKTPQDYVICSGKLYSIRDFIKKTCKFLGITIEFKGSGFNEIGIVRELKKDIITNLKIGDIIIKVSKEFYRPNEVDKLLGNAYKAKKELGWKPKISIEEMIREMVEHDISYLKSIKKHI